MISSASSSTLAAALLVALASCVGGPPDEEELLWFEMGPLPARPVPCVFGAPQGKMLSPVADGVALAVTMADTVGLEDCLQEARGGWGAGSQEAVSSAGGTVNSLFVAIVEEGRATAFQRLSDGQQEPRTELEGLVTAGERIDVLAARDDTLFLIRSQDRGVTWSEPLGLLTGEYVDVLGAGTASGGLRVFASWRDTEWRSAVLREEEGFTAVPLEGPAAEGARPMLVGEKFVVRDTIGQSLRIAAEDAEDWSTIELPLEPGEALNEWQVGGDLARYLGPWTLDSGGCRAYAVQVDPEQSDDASITINEECMELGDGATVLGWRESLQTVAAWRDGQDVIGYELREGWETGSTTVVDQSAFWHQSTDFLQPFAAAFATDGVWLVDQDGYLYLLDG